MTDCGQQRIKNPTNPKWELTQCGDSWEAQEEGGEGRRCVRCCVFCYFWSCRRCCFLRIKDWFFVVCKRNLFLFQSCSYFGNSRLVAHSVDFVTKLTFVDNDLPPQHRPPLVLRPIALNGFQPRQSGRETNGNCQQQQRGKRGRIPGEKNKTFTTLTFFLNPSVPFFNVRSLKVFNCQVHKWL